ncbi:MAG: asparagine synthase C-terminal domain-containing protein [Nitrososphaerales archaeon]
MAPKISPLESLRTDKKKEIESMSLELRKLVFKAVADTLGDSILLSGGLDTTIVAAVVSSLLGKNKDLRAYTILLKDSPAPDLSYSKLASALFCIPHQIRVVSLKELEEALPDVIRVLKSFDPMEIRNSVTVYLGLKEAKLGGFRRVMTGDASDELFAGYSFVFKLQRDLAQATLRHLWEVMHFSSVPLAQSLGIQASLPFLESGVKEFAMSQIEFDFLIGYKGEVSSGSEVFGKYILRKAFEDMLPREITWRTKTPIECGSGTTILPQIYSEKLGDFEFEEKKARYLQTDKVKIRDKEHLKYYEIFREIFGAPSPLDRSKRMCPACTFNVPGDALFCTTCGEFPI